MSVKTLPLQRAAADPDQSVWVSAAAGTGKTRVLVDRLLRLLLDGVTPSSILCITFTKAAAAEVDERVRQRLTSWVTGNDKDVIADLTDMLGVTPDAATINTARLLFSRLLNSKRPLAIQTIHSFCQSVLARFPLESGLLPGFSIASDQQTTQLQLQAFQQVLTETLRNQQLRQACARLFDLADRQQILDLLKNLQRQQDKWLDQANSDFSTTLYQLLQLPLQLDHETHRAGFYAQTDTNRLRGLAGAVDGLKTATAQKYAQSLLNFISTLPTLSQTHLDAYIDSVMTDKRTINHHIANLTKKLPDDLADLLQNEFNRIAAFDQTRFNLNIALRNQDLLLVAIAFVRTYQKLKQHHALLDYNDQIRLTAQLLTTSDQAPWVMYKLDGGIRHLLVDEAQDTSPAQWLIVDALAKEMAAGNSYYEATERSIFIVGDEKQSIYSFQDADIESYQLMRQKLKDLYLTAQLPWQDLQLTTNFRSSPAILSTVDGVFSNPFLHSAITREERVEHTASHAQRSGVVEAWPLFRSDPEFKDDDYIPTTIVQERKATEHLCQTIADTIKGWLQAGRTLPRMNRPIQPKDIMILLQNRRPLLNPLIKALKDRQIAVSGVDRLVLTEQLIVMDLVALLQVILLPQDDLTLASLLKSPLFNLDDDQLYHLAAERGAAPLWQRLQDQQQQYSAIISYLDDLFSAYKKGAGPYHLLALAVNRPCPADAKSGRHALIKRLGFDAEDSLDELLNAALQFEQEETPDVQLFLQWLSRNDAEIKRDTSGAQHNMVRIMTTHGAKGLQAPIVFLADASAKPSLFKTQRDMLWAENLPLWVTEKNNLPTPLQQPLAQDEKATLDEYYRLLYVAMTRAEDELYVTGWAGERETQKEITDWHRIIWDYLQTHGEPDDKNNPENTPYRFAFTGDDKATGKEETPVTQVTINPDDLPWLRTAPPVLADDRPHPLRPSRPPHIDPGALSPLQQDSQSRFARGLIVHKVLQHLTSYAPTEQPQALRAMLSYDEFGLTEHDQQTLYDELHRLISALESGFIFTTEGYNEITVTGSTLYRGKEFAVIGKIDRLVFHDDAWWIIDYKTNRPPARTPDEVPDAYLLQIASYRALIKDLYPGVPVHGALLWTFSNTLMTLPDAQLDAIMTAGTLHA